MLTQDSSLKTRLNRLTDYKESIKRKLISLGSLEKVSFYIMLQFRDGRLHQLNPGDIELINGCHPNKGSVTFERYKSMPVTQLCGWDQVWVDENEFVKSIIASEFPNSFDINESQTNTLLKLFYVMAIDGYSFNPSSKRSSTSGGKRGSIHAASKLVGLEVSDDSIRKLLSEAKEKFPHARPHKS